VTVASSTFSCAKPEGANEDFSYCGHLVSDAYVIAVADGVGGNEAGSIASRLAIEKAVEVLRSRPSATAADVFSEVQQTIAREARIAPLFASMATTLTLCELIGPKAIVMHVGDSRLYHLRGAGLITRTKDQTEVQRLMEEGVLNRDAAKKYPRRHVLLSALSATKNYDVLSDTFMVEVGDRLIAMTDGAHKVIAKPEIRDISARHPSFDQFVSELQREILARSPKDDATVAVAEVLPG
jgi:serine/threonine protein phosphatase PrpC